MILFHKGHVFLGPDGQGYTLTKDARVGDDIVPEAFEAFGGAPEPEYGLPVPYWLEKQITGE